EDPHHRLVRQLERQQGEPRSEERRVLGRPDLGRDAVHGDHVQPERRPGQDQQRGSAVMRRLTLAAAALCAVAAATVSAAGQERRAGAAPPFSKEVARILYKNCTNCHRPGEIAPMSLLTFKDARPWAKSIATQVSKGAMPPWH